MNIKKGENRLTIILPKIGIVIKLPIIRLYLAFRIFLDCFRNKKYILDDLRNELRYAIDIHMTIKRSLFKGIVDNWREWRFYRKTHSAFCQPTFFSLLGFINIQPIAPPLSLDRLDFLCQIDRLIGDAVNKDSHHFFNLANFGLTDTGKLKILDYGSPQTQEIIVESGDEIVRNFDPKFRRKKTDKKT